MSRGYYNNGFNNMYEVDHRYEEIPDIDPSMDFESLDDSAFYYRESPTRILRPVDNQQQVDPAERSLLLRSHMNGLMNRPRRTTPPQPRMASTPTADANNGKKTAAVIPCKARRRLDVYGTSLPGTPTRGDVFAPMIAQTAVKPGQPTVRRARSSAALYNKHKRQPEFLSEYNLDTCVPATGVQYNRPRNTAVIQPIYKAPSSVFQVRSMIECF